MISRMAIVLLLPAFAYIALWYCLLPAIDDSIDEPEIILTSEHPAPLPDLMPAPGELKPTP